MENWWSLFYRTASRIFLVILIIFVVVTILNKITGSVSFKQSWGLRSTSASSKGGILGAVFNKIKHFFLKGAIALVGVILFQNVPFLNKRKCSWFESLNSSGPVPLMENGKFIINNLRKTNISAKDIYAKLKEIDTNKNSEVLAVVLEITGDISIIHKRKNSDSKKASIALIS